MFSSIGQIFQSPPRQAEHSDTRQDIQRHDPEFERRKRKKQDQNEEGFTEEGANISVQALRAFLENFLKSLTEEQTSEEQTTAQPPQNLEQPEFAWEEPLQPKTQPTQRPVSGQAAYAANTYQSIAHAGEKRSILRETGIDGAPDLKLEASEVRTIHAILEDLKIVEDKKIEYIHIEYSDSFLHSIATAVEKIKHGPSVQI